MQIVNQKFQSLPLIYLKERSGWIVNHIHLPSIPHVSNQSSHAIYNFSFSMDRFYIIWGLGFG
jgi:hypothetical protein